MGSSKVRGFNMNLEEIFTCKECESHSLRVVWLGERKTNHHEELACECEGGEGGIAAVRVSEKTETLEGWGYLDVNHRWGTEKEEIINSEEEEIIFDVFCSDCLEEASQDDWEVTDEESENDDIEFYVYCDECEREIEFGWSHQNQGGRIWPAECIDFNPWKSFPELRYKESWAKKGWLKPLKRK